MIGHSGASGAVLFYVPDLDLSISGTVNQIRKRSLSYNLMVRLVFAVPGCMVGQEVVADENRQACQAGPALSPPTERHGSVRRHVRHAIGSHNDCATPIP